MGQFNPKIHWTTKMNRLTALLFVAAVSAAPMEDTPEVAAAKAQFKAAFNMAEAGEHIKLAPVNNDVQAEQIAQAYMADSEDVAAAKAEFQAAFDDAAAGGLAAKQAPAPVHTVPVAHYAAYPYLTSYPSPYGAYPYAHVGAYPYAHVGAYAAYPYAHIGAYPVLAASNVVKS